MSVLEKSEPPPPPVAPILRVCTCKASVTTGRTCLVIVPVLRIIPVVAPVDDRSVKNRV